MTGSLRAALLVAIVGTIVWTCGGTLFPERGSSGTARVVIYGFSILAEPMREEIFPVFRARWRDETGEDVEFVDSFAGSGTITTQIVNGAPADIAILSHPRDADRIVEARRATRPWRGRPFGGYLNRTPIVLAVRKGNPKGVTSFSSLGLPGITLVHPDPATSGGAEWAILAEYAEPIMLARRSGRQPSEELAAATLSSIWRNVVAQAPSARAARTQFDQGFGDALVTYEVEVLLDIAKGRSIEVVVPRATILCEHPIVLVDRNVTPSERPVVDAFVEFLTSPEAQRAFVRHGFRSVIPSLDAENPALARLECPYTADDLGGFTSASREIVHGIWKNQVLFEARR